MADWIRYLSRARSSPCRAALKLQGQLLPLRGCSRSLQPLHPSVSLWVNKSPRPRCCQKKMSPAAVLLLQTKEGKFFAQGKEVPLGSVRWEEAGWIQTLVLPPQSAGCSLGLGDRASCSSSPPHFTSPDLNPAQQTLTHSAGAAQKAPLAVPCSAWCHQEGIDRWSGTWRAPKRVGVRAVSLASG